MENHNCNHPLCDGVRHEELGKRTLCEHDADFERIMNTYIEPKGLIVLSKEFFEELVRERDRYLEVYRESQTANDLKELQFSFACWIIVILLGAIDLMLIFK